MRMALFFLCFAVAPAWAQSERVVDIPTRPGVTQRILVLGPEKPKAAVILFAGGDGGLRLTPQGEVSWGKAISSCARAPSSPSRACWWR